MNGGASAAHERPPEHEQAWRTNKGEARVTCKREPLRARTRVETCGVRTGVDRDAGATRSCSREYGLQSRLDSDELSALRYGGSRGLRSADGNCVTAISSDADDP